MLTDGRARCPPCCAWRRGWQHARRGQVLGLAQPPGPRVAHRRGAHAGHERHGGARLCACRGHVRPPACSKNVWLARLISGLYIAIPHCAQNIRGTSLQQVKVFTNDGQSLSTIRYHDGFLGQRIGPISSLTFHPHQMLMAVGSTDSLVSIFTSERAVPGTGAAA